MFASVAVWAKKLYVGKVTWSDEKAAGVNSVSHRTAMCIPLWLDKTSVATRRARVGVSRPTFKVRTLSVSDGPEPA